jgi:hypothetical protein
MKVRAQTEVAGSAGWFRRMTAVLVAATFVALASTVAYQNAVTIPHLKSGTSPSLAQVYGPTFSLPADGSGAWTPQVSIHPTDGFLLDFKFNPTYLFNSYFCQLQDASGHPLLQTRVSAEKVNQELHLVVPAGVVQRPGSYSLVLLGADPGAAGPVRNSVLWRIFAADPASAGRFRNVVQRLTFSVLFLQ